MQPDQTNPLTGTDLLAQAIEAARSGDEPALRALIDWPLSGIAVVAESLRSVDESDRTEAVTSGLAELDAASGDPAVVELILTPVAARLAAARTIEPASPRLRAEVLDRLRVPGVPSGLTESQTRRISDLRARAAGIDEVYVIDDDEGELPIARTPDTGRLVLLLD